MKKRSMFFGTEQIFQYKYNCRVENDYSGNTGDQFEIQTLTVFSSMSYHSSGHTISITALFCMAGQLVHSSAILINFLLFIMCLTLVSDLYNKQGKMCWILFSKSKIAEPSDDNCWTIKELVHTYITCGYETATHLPTNQPMYYHLCLVRSDLNRLSWPQFSNLIRSSV